MPDTDATEAVVRLTPDERQLVLAALRLLRSTLGHEEAEELAEVQALIRRIEAPERRAG